MKKIIALLLSLVMVLTSFSVLLLNVSAEDAPIAPQPGTDAYVQALEQAGYTALNSFSDVTDYSAAAKYYLTADITLSSDATVLRGGDFYGVLDGNGHTVYNSMNSLFKTLKGTLKNITFSKYTSAEKTDVFETKASLINNIGNGAVLENVISDRTFYNDIADYWGAIVREVPANASVTFRGVVNNSSIGYPYVGYNIKIGGFIGLAQNNCTIVFEDCVNNATVKGSQAGGFIAVLMGGNNITFKNCTNNGTVLGSIGSSMNGEAARGVAGGFIGSLNNCYKREASLNITFENCTNAGDVLRWEGSYSACTKTDYKVAQGGFIGNLGEGGNANNPLTLTFKNCKVSSCYVGAGTVWSDIVNETTGAVTTDYTQGYVGAIMGWLGTTNNTDVITIENVTVNNVKIESADPAYASLFINTNEAAQTVVLKNCIAYTCEGATSAATGNVNFANTAASTGVTVNKTQKSAVQDEKLSLRFLGGVDSLSYTSLGFIVKETVNGTSTYYFLFARAAYNEVNNGSSTLTKADFNGSYITAAILDNVSATETATYEVTPYAIDLDGNAVVGHAKSITVTNGSLS